MCSHLFSPAGDTTPSGHADPTTTHITLLSSRTKPAAYASSGLFVLHQVDRVRRGGNNESGPPSRGHLAMALTMTLIGATTMADEQAITVEEWRAIPGHEHYEVSSLGRVRSLDRVVDLFTYGKVRRRSHKGRIIRQVPSGTKGAYLYVGLSTKTDTKFGVHRLVALAFHGDPPSPAHHAAHNNGKSQDNRASNISWKTPAENNADKKLHGTDNHYGGMHGSEHHKAVLTEAVVHDIRSKLTGKRGELTRIAVEYGVHVSTIWRIRNGKGWTHI